MSDLQTAEPEARIVAALRRHTLRTSAQLVEMTGLGVGRLYPALLSLEQAGTVASEWEDMPPPRRRRYRLVEETQR